VNFYAHTLENEPPEKWEPLFSADCPALTGEKCTLCASLDPFHGHLNKVAWWTARFAAQMFPPGPDREAAHQWGYLAGLWHDLGKFAPKWQEYLKSKSDPHADEIVGKEDHSTAGAAFTHEATNPSSPFGDLFSYLIAGHHAGLADGNYLFEERLKKAVNPWRSSAEVAGVPLDRPIPMPPLKRPDAGNDGMALMLRFFFSCLVDADFLATESFMSSSRSELRQPWPDDILEQMLAALENHMTEKFTPSGEDLVSRARESVRLDCIHAAKNDGGFFSLTVPTGGGKTLSSLLFALRHALKNGHRRVIFVIPFTSIIKQNADVFRDVFASLAKKLGRDIVLEHHSKFDPKNETERNRLTAENWDTPLVVTTNVQFFESLYANRTSACRKLHRIARSVVIFDEVQALPAGLLHPILRALRCLVHDLHASAVLCTATQPALERRADFTVGIPPEEITPIIRNESTLFVVLNRVECENLGAINDDHLIAHILEHAPTGCLLILNTTKAAQALHEKLNLHTNALHLSARMCPRHVMLVLARAKRLRKNGLPVVLVSTQLIEAGVDISFPVVYRAECGLDSFAQAAGRCNRNGELFPQKGHVFLFQPTDHPIPKALTDIRANAAITRTQILPNLGDKDLLHPELIRVYFKHAIWQAGPKTSSWDKPQIVSGEACFPPNATSFHTYKFKTAAETFRLIDSNTHPVLIPWGAKGRKLAQEIRDLKKQSRVPNRSHYRRAQQFTVQVYDGEWQDLKPHLSLHCEEAFAILDHPENSYHPQTGLKRPDAPADSNAFYI